jgi:hypothetical protein
MIIKIKDSLHEVSELKQFADSILTVTPDDGMICRNKY